MRLLGLAAIYQRPNTSNPAAAHKIYPYLLRGLAIERVNQVWCSDVTYIPMAKGFLYLVVIMDWVSRAVLAWRVSNTLGADFCVEAGESRVRTSSRRLFWGEVLPGSSHPLRTEFSGVLVRCRFTSLDGDGFELVWGFFCQAVVLGCADSFLFGAGMAVFRPVAWVQVRG